MKPWGRPGLISTGVSHNSAHNVDSKCVFALCFFKTNYEKVKTAFPF